MHEDYFEKLHDKIMAEVEKTGIASGPMLMAPRSVLRSQWRGWLYPVGGIISVIIFAFLLMSPVSKVNQSLQRVGLFSDGRDRIAVEALKSPEDLSQTLISIQNESDFFMDVASESFENLSVDNLNKIVGEQPN